MIFLTVGAQLPFERLVRAVDRWAAVAQEDVFAQIGGGAYLPRHMRFARFLQPQEFTRRVQQAQMIVAHAGMGSILAALEHGKPIIILPRRADLHEHRNDHQFATARRMQEQGVRVARDEQELASALASLHELAPPRPLSPIASPKLLGAIRQFIAAGQMPAPLPAASLAPAAPAASSSAGWADSSGAAMPFVPAMPGQP